MKWAIWRIPALQNTPTSMIFNDIGSLGIQDQKLIEQAHALGITAGTTQTTFSPNENTPFWQWAILYGKTQQVILNH
jgi:hypothetical protein